MNLEEKVLELDAHGLPHSLCQKPRQFQPASAAAAIQSPVSRWLPRLRNTTIYIGVWEIIPPVPNLKHSEIMRQDGIVTITTFIKGSRQSILGPMASPS